LKRAFSAAGVALAVVFVGTLALPATAAAQQERISTPYEWIDRSLRAGVYGGYISTGRGESEIGPGSSSVFGGRLRARISSPLSFELNVGLGSSERAVIDPRLDAGPAAVDTVDVDWLLVEGGFQIALTGARTVHGIQPYVTLGGGILRGIGEKPSEFLSAPGDEDFRYRVGTAASFAGGIGFEWLPVERIGVGFEVRDHLWRIKTPDGFFRADVLDRIDELGLPAPHYQPLGCPVRSLLRGGQRHLPCRAGKGHSHPESPVSRKGLARSGER
jgi:hypothetical protein